MKIPAGTPLVLLDQGEGTAIQLTNYASPVNTVRRQPHFYLACGSPRRCIFWDRHRDFPPLRRHLCRKATTARYARPGGLLEQRVGIGTAERKRVQQFVFIPVGDLNDLNICLWHFRYFYVCMCVCRVKSATVPLAWGFPRPGDPFWTPFLETHLQNPTPSERIWQRVSKR